MFWDLRDWDIGNLATPLTPFSFLGPSLIS
jgi:hypothetical protein